MGGGISTNTLCINVVIVSGNLALIHFNSSRVSLTCDEKTAGILRVPCTINVDPRKTLSESTAKIWIGKVNRIQTQSPVGCHLAPTCPASIMIAASAAQRQGPLPGLARRSRKVSAAYSCQGHCDTLHWQQGYLSQ